MHTGPINVDTAAHTSHRKLLMPLPSNSFLLPLLSQDCLQALVAMRHVNIAPIYSISLRTDKVFQVCTEPYVLSTLRHVVDELSFLESECSVRLAASIFVGALEALAYLAYLGKIWGLNLDIQNMNWLDMLCVDDRGQWKIIVHKVSSYQSGRKLCNSVSDTHTFSNTFHAYDEMAQICLPSMRSLGLVVLNLLIAGSHIDLEESVALRSWNKLQRDIACSRNNDEIADLKLFIDTLSTMWNENPNQLVYPYHILIRLLPILQTYMKDEPAKNEAMHPRHERKSKYSPLMFGVLSKDYKLVQRHISYAGCRTTSGMTALMMAARDNFVEAVQILLPYEAHYKTFLGTKFESRTALMFATHNHSHDSMHILYEQEAGIANVYGATALMRAAQNGDCTAVEILMKREAGMVNYTGVTALMNGAAKGSTKVVGLLLPFEAGRITNDRHEWGKGHSALSLAAINANNEVVLLLYDAERQLVKSRCILTSGKTVIEELIEGT
ncbi:Protein 21.1 [Giardia lamblia P15]|uniref:Protein 21.1 n=1 Tax=Giardia intestinalis (strain P15) TaxID=658858 RepID=E1F458_GIAIA|nr:Protein 21.1 [Giardia lamblia P15]